MADVITRFKVDTDQFDRKINSAKRSLDQFGLKGSEVGKNIEGLANALSLNVSSMSALSVALAAGGAALKVLGDAFKQNEMMQDEWGRITESSKSLYEGFLSSLNNGNVSGFLSNISSIVQAARDAYDALDELGTFNAFNQINTEKARTGLTTAIADFRDGNGTKADVQAAADALNKELDARQKLEYENYLAEIRNAAKTHNNVDADLLLKALSGSYGDYNNLKALPISGKEWKKTSSNPLTGEEIYGYVAAPANEEEKLGAMLRELTDEELNNLQALGAQAQRTATEIAQINRQVARLRDPKTAADGTESTSSKTGKEAKVYAAGSIGAAEQELAALNEQFKSAADDQSRTQIKNQIDQLTESIKKMRVESVAAKKVVAEVFTGASGYSQENINAMKSELQQKMQQMQLGSSEYMAAFAKSIDIESFTNLVNEAIRNGVQIDQTVLENIFEAMFDSENIPDDVWVELANTINEHLAELGIDPIEVDVKTGNVSQKENAQELAVLGDKAREAWSGATSAIGSVGSALQSIENPGAKVAGLIASAIASVAAGLGEMLAQPQSTSQSWGWIALAASGAATMASTVAAIKSVTSGYADGGIIGSLNGSLNSPSGDNIVARLNAGEGVLTRTGIESAQRMSEGGGFGSLHFEKVITGSEIRLILSNDNRARGGSRSAYAVR